MPKINKEEYEILKEKYDMGGKWISRDADGLLYYYKERPNKLEHPSDNMWYSNSFTMDIIGDGKKLFHFVKWSDSSPYNIAELIREYEIKELRLAPSGTVIVDSFDESEGTEVLSQEWIDEHKVARVNNLRKMTMSDVVPVDKLQDLLVPKQEKLETKIQELIESYKQEEDAYSNPENGWIGGFIEDLKNLVEKEQKYHVTDENDTLLCKSNGVVMTVGKLWAIGNDREAEYDLTEQEIKDYDERYWAFAVEVAE